MAHEVGTVTIKLTDVELNHAITSLEFYTTLDLPVDNEYLKPYDELKGVLLRIKKKLKDYKLEVMNDKKKNTEDSVYQQEDCETCD